MLRRLGQRGDTIVEVLVAIGILGVIVGGGYSIATRSLNGIRASEERSAATKIAESQMERLLLDVQSVTYVPDIIPFMSGADYATYIPLADPTLGYPPTQIGYCYDSVGIITRMETLPGDSLESTDSYPAACKFGENGLYNVSLTGTLDGASNTVILGIEVRWDRAGGEGKEKIRMVYRVSVQ